MERENSFLAGCNTQQDRVSLETSGQMKTNNLAVNIHWEKVKYSF